MKKTFKEEWFHANPEYKASFVLVCVLTFVLFSFAGLIWAVSK